MWNNHATADWLLAVPGSEAIVTAGGVGELTAERGAYDEHGARAHAHAGTGSRESQLSEEG